MADPEDPNSILFKNLKEVEELGGHEEAEELEKKKMDAYRHGSDLDRGQLYLQLVAVLAAIRFNTIYSDINEYYYSNPISVIKLNKSVDKQDFLMAYNAAQKQWMKKWSDLRNFYFSNLGMEMIINNLLEIYPKKYYFL